MKSSLQQKYSKERSISFSMFDFGLMDGFAKPNRQSQLALSGLLNRAEITYRQDDDSEYLAKLPKHTPAEILVWATAALIHSPTAKAMLAEAASEDWALSLEDLGSHDFHLDVPEKHIILNTHGLLPARLGASDYFRNIVLVSFIRALRDVYQEKRHGGFEDTYGPESILMLERVRAADCDTMTVLVCWELRASGLGDLWRYLIGSDEGDMAMAFSSHLERNPAAANSSHDALFAAFRQWYACEDRINICDHETLEYLDNIMLGGYESDIFGNQYLSAKRLEILSCLPDKTAYLQGRGDELVSNPVYSGLSDPINQSHFMHIMHDMQSTIAAGVAFRSADLAEKIFPAELMAAE